MLGVATAIQTPPSVPVEKISYVPCPVCRQLMHRVNFARCSNVVVDICKPHGTWFDKDELRRIVEFIQVGGFAKARADEIAELERQRRQLESARTSAALDRPSIYQSADSIRRENALSLAAAAVLSSFFD